jgi:small-conductance mechanosensitive channel/CRP-like cAMP-binding protein
MMSLLRLAAPKRKEIKLGAAIAFTLLYAAAYLCHVLVDWPPFASAAGTAAIIFIALAIARLLFLSVFDLALAIGRTDPFPRIVRDLSQAAIVFLASLIALRAAGVEFGQLLTTSALLSVVAGLALQETLGNFLAGLTLQADRPFHVGDWIEVHGQPGQTGPIGKVSEINWRATRMRTLDNVEIIVPNGPLSKLAITNYDSPYHAARRSIYFHTPYSTPTRDVHEIVLAAISDAPGVLATPQPTIVTFAFDEAGVNHWLRFFLDDMGRRDVIDGGVRDRIWYALSRASIPISVPGRRLDLHEITEASEALKKAHAVGERAEALSKIELFSSLPEEVLEMLAEHAKSAHFAPGEIVIRQGDVGDSMFVVVRGELAVRVAKDGNEAEAARISGGSFFGEMSLLTGDRRVATIAALGPCELLVIDHAGFRELLSGNPKLLEVISAKVAQRQMGLDASKPMPAAGTKVQEQSNLLLDRIRRFFHL